MRSFGGLPGSMSGRKIGVDIGIESGGDRIARGYPFGTSPVRHEAWFMVVFLRRRIGHFRSRDLISRKTYASKFERIRAKTLPKTDKKSINTSA